MNVDYEDIPIDQARRIKCALALLVVNLRGEGLESLKPIGRHLSSEMADLGADAFYNRPNDRLDASLADILI